MNADPATVLVWGLECEACKAMYTTPAKPWPGGKCKACEGDLVMVGAGRATYAEDGTVARIEHVSMTSREVAEAMTEGVFEEGPLRALMTRRKRCAITSITEPKPKAKKRSGKSPTRKVVPVARGHHARWERRMAEPREPVTLGGDPLDAAREAFPDISVSRDVVAQMPEFNRLAGVRESPVDSEADA